MMKMKKKEKNFIRIEDEFFRVNENNNYTLSNDYD